MERAGWKDTTSKPRSNRSQSEPQALWAQVFLGLIGSMAAHQGSGHMHEP